jgi:hypothetical protein
LGPQLTIVSALVSIHLVRLRLNGGHKQLEHKVSLALAVEVVGQFLQASRLPRIESGVPAWVVANQLCRDVLDVLATCRSCRSRTFL